MIKIEFEAATGADLRKEMLDLLGLSGEQTVTLSGRDIFTKIGDGITSFKDLPIVEDLNVEQPATTEEAPKPEPTTRKRRSKAEIEAEAALAANTGSEEPPASTENVAEETPVDKEEVAITGDDLIKMAVAIARTVGAEGRDANLAMLEKDFKGATISKKDGKPQLTTDQYPAVVEGFHRVITPFLPKLNDDQKKDLVKAGFNLGA